MNQKIEEIFQLQRSHASQWGVSKAKARIQKLNQIKDWLDRNQDRICNALQSDFKKPEVETLISEVMSVRAEVTHVIKHLSAWMQPQAAPTPMTLLGGTSEVQSQAKGVVLIISPWNYPFSLAVSPLIFALAAGNTAVIKPSEMTPHTSALLKSFVAELFKEQEVALFEGDAETSQALLKLPFDHIFFTGSPRVGKLVMKAAAEHLSSVTLELGGKSPVIIDASANIPQAARRIMWGKFFNGGQTCIAPDYAFIHKTVKEQFVNECKKAVQAYFSQDLEKNIAHSVSEGSHQRMLALRDEALADGAQSVDFSLDGNGKGERFFPPTVLDNVTPEMRVMKEEIFGPILPILSFEQETEVVDFIRKNDKPLALYLFSNHSKRTKYYLKNTTSGGVAVNHVLLHFGNPHLPFGGVGPSGFGSYHGEFGFKEFSHQRAVYKQGSFTLTEQFFPPYTPKVKKLVKTVMRFLT